MSRCTAFLILNYISLRSLRIKSNRTQIVVILAHHVPREAVSSRHPLELVQRLPGHAPAVPVPRHDQATGVVQDRQFPAPQREHVIALVGPGHDSPTLHLGGEGSVGVHVLHDPGVRQGDVGDGDDDVGGASVIFPAAVCHVVYPLPVVLSYESLVLTWIAVITSGIVSLATIQPPGYPPITLNLSKSCEKIIFNRDPNAPPTFYLFQAFNIFQAVFVFPQTNSVVRVVNQTFVVYKTTYSIKKLWILVAVGHLAYVSTASNSIVPFIECARLYTFWKVS